MWSATLFMASLVAMQGQTLRAPLHSALDLNVGEQVSVRLRNGSTAGVRVVDLKESRDPFRSAVREAIVTVSVNGTPVELVCGNYRLPVTVAEVQIDCPVSRGVRSNANGEHWGLRRDVRLRLWPAGSPWIEPGTFRYPARQRWFASGTQMANEPTFVDGGEVPGTRLVYYHSGLDIGGAEGLVEVVAATDGLVVSSGTARLDGHDDSPVAPRYDVVYLLDDRGWYYRYSHMQSIDPAITPGATVKMGQKIGVLGKEGGSGGWAHLHFEVKSRQPSGEWGTEEGYAFLWQSYVAEFDPPLLAVARPHRLAAVGEPVPLDGSRSWSGTGGPLQYEWRLSDGSTASGARATRTYDRAGTYSEILKVTNAAGETAYDFAVVQVLDPNAPEALPPTIQAAFAPTFDLKAGDLVTFKVRTFRTIEGEETWDFGDGTPPVTVKSDGNANIHDPNGFAVTEHRFARAGDYLVSVSRTNARGLTATAHVWVPVGPRTAAAFEWPDGKRVAVSLTFDDGRASQVEGGTAVLDRFGVKATFYVTPAAVERRLDGWKQAAASGHEIANHSLVHPCSGNFAWSRERALEDYTPERMRGELLEANRRIAELLGVAPPESFAYPCGQTFVGRGADTRSYVPVAAELFVSARGWLDEAPNDPAYVDFAQLTGMPSDTKTFDEIRTVVEAARESGLWVVLAGHDMAERHGAQTTRLSVIAALCAYAADPANAVWLAPVGEVARYVRNHRGF